MPNFWFRGQITYTGAEFLIIADTEEEAKARAQRNECDEANIDTAEMSDWTISPRSCVEDK